MLEILGVDRGSIAEELDLNAGDFLLSINGEVIRDLLDYQVHAESEDLLLEIRKRDGQLWDLEIEKDAFEPLGLNFPHPEPTQCGNNCIFCFVHQLPRGMRRTLYVKDEDFRFSYLYGSYVTLTNIAEADIDRILRQRLSPLYVSVHATDEQLRTRMLGRSGPPILELLERLTAGGIEVHTQIVLCPGFNDGPQLQKSLNDLYGLHPGVASLAVVPVGLTGYRQRLPRLRPLSVEDARQALDLVEEVQRRALEASGTRFVFAADELYLQARRDFPPVEAYEDLSQLENGVGLIPVFRSEARQVLEECEALEVPEVSTLTGESSLTELRRFIAQLEGATGTRIHLYPVVNHFFGGAVTVTGLLTGADIIEQLRGRELGQVLLVPEVTLKDGEDVFLDDVTLHDLERELGVEVVKVESTPWGLYDGLASLAE